MRAIHLLVCLAAFAVTGCATRGPAVPPANGAGCPAGLQPQTAVSVSADPLQATRHRIGPAANGCEAVALFRLPRFRDDWTLDVGSVFDGESLFAPRVEVLDEQGRVLRELSFERFSMRGERLQATLFFGASGTAARFLRVRPAAEVLGRTGKRLVSGAIVVPLINAVMPLLYMQGTESERRYTYADHGVLTLSAMGAGQRQPQALDVARRELGAFAH